MKLPIDYCNEHEQWGCDEHKGWAWPYAVALIVGVVILALVLR
jgi:hypothetical protein